MQRCPDLDLVCQNLPSVLQLLTNMTLESMAELMPDGEMDPDEYMLEHFKRVSQLCDQINIDKDKLKPRWNKTYGEGGTCWEGELDDGVSRGDMPYFCPSGWARFALDVCSDDQFEEKFNDWGYLYHGTKGKFVGSILTSGLRASPGLCYCGEEDHAVYMSPSIEYCGHPRYSHIEFNPQTKHWLQVALQCRVNPKMVWQKCQETMYCDEFGLHVDSNFENNGTMEWLFKANYTDPATGHKYLKDAVVCTGIMVRVTKHHPNDGSYWWTQQKAYLERWGLLSTQVDPQQPMKPTAAWKQINDLKMTTYKMTGDPAGSDMKVDMKFQGNIGKAWLAPKPFAAGSMRYAYYLRTEARGDFVVKVYNDDTQRHITEVLKRSVKEMLLGDVTTYLTADHYAHLFNQQRTDEWKARFLEPVIFSAGGEIMFGEALVHGDSVKGTFLKWNNNAGGVNEAPEAKKDDMARLVTAFSHFTYEASKRKLMVVDIQGWNMGSGELFTDPQIHTRYLRASPGDRQVNQLCRRFSVANLGKTGMAKFFISHKCGRWCKAIGLSHPMNQKKGKTVNFKF